MKTIKVSIVDDHKIFRDGLRLLLEDISFVELIDDYPNGKVFIEDLLIHKPEIAFMDISMPEMNGIETTKKALKLYPQLKVIALTSFGDENYFHKMNEAGAIGFMLKTAERYEFEKAIEMVSKGENYFSHEVLLNLTKSNLNSEFKKNKEILDSLTCKEKEVLEYTCKGLSNEEIAKKLNISKRTIEGYRSKILNKTNCRNSVQLVLFAIKNNFITLE